jgi:hypothetical protein
MSSASDPRPSRFCGNCLHDTFVTHVRFDEDGEIAWYLTRDINYVKCASCSQPVTLPTPLDVIA